MATPNLDERWNRWKELALLMLKEAPGDCLVRAAAIAQVEAAEQALGVRFPLSYQWFLRTFGCANYPDYIFGLNAGNAVWLDVVRQTEGERHEFEPHTPHHLIPFYNDGWGNHYCLDTSRLADGECPVAFWNHDGDDQQVPKEIHATFLDCLEALVKELIEWQKEEALPRSA